MVRYFVIPRPEELFYSILSRYQYHTKSNTRNLSLSLFGRSQITANKLFPTHLDDFEKLVGSHFALEKERIIRDHSLIPLFSKILGRNSTKEWSCFSFSNINKRLIDSAVLKYCPICLEEQIHTYHEPYWHRYHNIPHVTVCYKHNCILELWVPGLEKIKTRNLFSLASGVRESTPSRPNGSTLRFELSKIVAHEASENRPIEKQALINHAQETGLISLMNGKVEINRMYSNSLTKFLSETVDNQQIAKINLKLIRHALFHQNFADPYLFFTIKRYIEEIPTSQSKIIPKVKCLCVNKVCPNFNNNQTTTFEFAKLNHKKNRAIKAHCALCGMKWTLDFHQKNRLVRIDDYGKLITRRIGNMLRGGYSFRQIERDLNIDRKIAAAIYTRKSGALRQTHSVSIVLLRQRRNAWETELNSDNYESIKKSADILKTEYRWLMKNDLKWMRTINRKFRKRTFTRVGNKVTIHVEDTKQVSILRAKMIALVKDDFPRQVSKSLLLSLPEFKGITPLKLRSLPKTLEFLESECESKFMFRKRQVQKFVMDNQMETKAQVIDKLKIRYRNKYSKAQQMELLTIVSQFYT